MVSMQGVRNALSAVLLFSAIALSAADLWGLVLTEPQQGLYKIDLANIFQSVSYGGATIVTDFRKYGGFKCNGQNTYVCITPSGMTTKRSFTGIDQAFLQILTTETSSQRFVFLLAGGDQAGCNGFERSIKFVFDYDITAGPATFVSAMQTSKCTYTLYFKTAQILASITDDPHYEGFQGQTYDVQGDSIPNKWYALLSDSDIEVNGQYNHLANTKGSSNNILTVGIRYYGHRISFQSSDQMIYVDGQVWDDITDDEMPGPYVLRDGKGNFQAILTRQYNRFYKLETFAHLVYFDAKLLITEEGETLEDEPYFNVEFAVINADRNPHGLIGQTAHRMTATQSTDPQGAGVIDGETSDYVVSSQYAYDFRYNKYTST